MTTLRVKRRISDACPAVSDVPIDAITPGTPA
jgi:hypothetical protein